MIEDMNEEWLRIKKADGFQNKLNELTNSFRTLYQQLPFETQSELMDDLNATVEAYESSVAKDKFKSFFDFVCNEINEPCLNEEQIIAIGLHTFRCALSDDIDEIRTYNLESGKIIPVYDRSGDPIEREAIYISPESITKAINHAVLNFKAILVDLDEKKADERALGDTGSSFKL